jgi:hypothetical protein
VEFTDGRNGDDLMENWGGSEGMASTIQPQGSCISRGHPSRTLPLSFHTAILSLIAIGRDLPAIMHNDYSNSMFNMGGRQC